MNTYTQLLRIGTQQYSPYVILLYIADFKQYFHLK